MIVVFFLMALGPVGLFLYLSKRKNKKYIVFMSMAIFVLSLALLGFVMVQIIHKSAIDRRIERIILNH